MARPLIIGAGMTGLAASLNSGSLVYEAEEIPGGICSSYYMRAGDKVRLHYASVDEDMYRFEIGGGHWIFGIDSLMLRFLSFFAFLKSYERKSAVFFPDQGLFVPYPIQHHLGYLGKDVASKALVEILTGPRKEARTMEEWLYSTFGTILTEMFFGPFHDLYTDGLWKEIAPQDSYKSPVVPELAIRGAFEPTPLVGYNTVFVYPVGGLDRLVHQLAEGCKIHYGRRVVQIDVHRKELLFENGSGAYYDVLVSTLPLNRMVELTRLHLDEPPGPYTSVLVLNLGAEKGPNCPNEHWLYIPQSRAGFYRVGFYSNVDASFLPKSAREMNRKVSIYVERSFRGGKCLSDIETQKYVKSVIQELQDWGWIGPVEVVDPTWIEIAYTWSWPSSQWREKALALLEKHDIIQAGRYGRWVFQGIAESIREGLTVSSLLKG